MDSQVQQAGDIDVDNLFNEENLNNAALGGGILSENAILHEGVFGSAPAQIKQLADYAVDGSLSRLTWSRPGVIANITDDGTVETSLQRLDTSTGKWLISKPRLLDPALEDIIGLAWSTTGGELAVLDKKGRVNVFNLLPTAANRFAHTRDGTADQIDESNQPIGLLWLSLSRNAQDKKKTVLENVKEDGKWKHEHVEGGYHPPHALRAFCFVGRRGRFNMLWTKDGGAFKFAAISLPTSEASVYTHAAMSQTPEGRLLVALHESTGDISMYAVNIIFMTNDAQTPPSLNVEVIDHRIPATPPYFDTSIQPATVVDGCVLTHFHIHPESEYSWDHVHKPHLPPKQPATLLAAYSACNNRMDAVGSGFFGTTVIKRWQLQPSQFQLHPRFGAKGNSNSEPIETNVQPLSDINISAPVTNLQVIEPGNAIAITTLDGTTAFYGPDSMKVISSHPNHSIVSSIGQVSFQYPLLMSSPTQCLSPHAMMLAHTSPDGKVELMAPKHRDYNNTAVTPRDTPRDLDTSKPQDEALIACCILSFSRSCWHPNSAFDDILASIHSIVTTTSLVHIRRQLFTTLFQPKNLVPGPQNMSELDKVPHSLIVYKALAFHFGLFNTHHHPSNEEKLAHLWTWIVLNLRWSIAIIGDTYKSLHQPQQPNPQNPQGRPQSQHSAQFLDLVTHNIRWVFALYNFIIQSILLTGDRRTHPSFFEPAASLPFSSTLGDDNGDGTQGLIALIMNCNWSRSFLLIMSRLMKAIATKGAVNINFANGKSNQAGISSSLSGTTLGRVAHTIQQCCLQHGITVNALEALFDQKYHPDKWGDEGENAATLERQVDMMVSGHVSETYQDTIRNVLDNCINGPEGLRVTGELDRLKLMDEMPEKSYVFLNMDDIAFGEHRPMFTFDERSVITGGDGVLDAFTDGDSMDESPKGKTRPARVLYDAHKKLPLFSQQSQALNPAVPTSAAQMASGMSMGLPRIMSTEELLAAQVRRCVRCGSLSDSNVEGVNKSWPRQLLQLMNRCVCDGSWIVEDVRAGLDLG